MVKSQRVMTLQFRWQKWVLYTKRKLLSVLIFGSMSIIIIINFYEPNERTICIHKLFPANDGAQRRKKFEQIEKKAARKILYVVEHCFFFFFLLITCLWIINWRILMFLLSLRSNLEYWSASSASKHVLRKQPSIKNHEPKSSEWK